MPEGAQPPDVHGDELPRPTASGGHIRVTLASAAPAGTVLSLRVAEVRRQVSVAALGQQGLRLRVQAFAGGELCGRGRTRLNRIRPNLAQIGQIWDKFGRVRPMLARVGAQFDQFWANSTKVRPLSAMFGHISAQVSPVLIMQVHADQI